jgi:hypothetical protein
LHGQKYKYLPSSSIYKYKLYCKNEKCSILQCDSRTVHNNKFIHEAPAAITGLCIFHTTNMVGPKRPSHTINRSLTIVQLHNFWPEKSTHNIKRNNRRPGIMQFAWHYHKFSVLLDATSMDAVVSQTTKRPIVLFHFSQFMRLQSLSIQSTNRPFCEGNTENRTSK